MRARLFGGLFLCLQRDRPPCIFIELEICGGGCCPIAQSGRIESFYGIGQSGKLTSGRNAHCGSIERFNRIALSGKMSFVPNRAFRPYQELFPKEEMGKAGLWTERALGSYRQV